MLIIKYVLFTLFILLALFTCLLILLIFFIGIGIKYDSGKGAKIYITIFKIPFTITFNKIESYILKGIKKREAKKQKKEKKKKERGMGIRVLKKLFLRISFRKFIFKVKYGLEDPMVTALVNGFLWSFISILYSVFVKNINSKKLQIHISPLFTEIKFDLYFECILRIKLLG